MITDYLFFSPGGEILCTREEIRRHVEQHYIDRQLCPSCDCYLVPTGQTQRFFFRTYRCANSICSATRRTLRFWPLSRRRAA